MYLDMKAGKAVKQVLGRQAGGHVSIDQYKIRRRRERIRFGNVPRIPNYVISKFQKRFHESGADPL